MAASFDPFAKNRLHTLVHILFAFVLVTVILRIMASILQPVFLALFLFYFGVPIRVALERSGVPPRPARFLVPVIVFLLSGLSLL